MAYSVVPKTKRDGKITLKDGSGVPVTLEIAYEDGNFSFSQPQRYGELVVMDRGNISAVRKQDEQIITGSFSCNMREFTDAVNPGSVRDFLLQSGFYSGNTSTGLSGAPMIEHYCVDIDFDVEGTDFGDDADHKVTLAKCICSIDFAEGDPSSFTINFNSYGGIQATGPV
jgi:hypothetical protein